MKNNIENIPAEIFDWIASRPFADLHSDQQNQVLKYMTSAEYEELNLANAAISNNLRMQQNDAGNKKDLLRLFDEKYPVAKPQVYGRNFMWKAASVILLISTLWLALEKREPAFKETSDKFIVHDTVFVDRPTTAAQKAGLQPNEMLATAPLPVQRSAKSKSKSNGMKPIINKPIPKAEYAQVQALKEDIQVLSINTLQNISNNSKRNSMQDDSLEKNFKFVSM